MRVLLDACVLYPTILREILLGAAERGLFTPLWSPRLLEEWRRAAARAGPHVAAQATTEIALLEASWPGSLVHLPEGSGAGLWLPDPDDVHVLAAAVAGRADALLTANSRDFPSRVLADHGLARLSPDPFLRALWAEAPEAVAGAVADAHRRAEVISGSQLPLRPLLKRAGLPRLARALSAPG
ncbi:MAG: PIN domain-containing protein [Rhodobacteraceae bacterium]|nr:PIN domain-containing protein [Paracoccaceae bacterium]